ncbi:hypothetical protein JB92DRAFT_2838300 [Gautieria morchelliformis]|nr:hypothetical protein JB92DRAFT_2838300 [Gautieria morchelliformis]
MPQDHPPRPVHHQECAQAGDPPHYLTERKALPWGLEPENGSFLELRNPPVYPDVLCFQDTQKQRFILQMLHTAQGMRGARACHMVHIVHSSALTASGHNQVGLSPLQIPPQKWDNGDIFMQCQGMRSWAEDTIELPEAPLLAPQLKTPPDAMPHGSAPRDPSPIRSPVVDPGSTFDSYCWTMACRLRIAARA